MKKIKMLKVQSSNILSVAYIPDDKEMFIKFKGNSIYKYSDVDHKIFDELMEARSKGGFMHKPVIKNLKFERIDMSKNDQYKFIDQEPLKEENKK